MAKVRFVADQIPTGIDGNLMLSIEDGKEKLREFLVQLRAKRATEVKKAGEEGRTPERYLMQVELGVAYRPRTLKQHNLQWELCQRIAKQDHVDPDTVHEAMKQIVYPKEEHYDAWIAKDGEELSTVEYAQAIEWLIHECIDRPDPVDIQDIWILFTDWRYQQEYDPITYTTPESYREAHPCCEVCGKFLLQRDQEGVYRNIGHLSHFLGRGAGGPDYASWDVIMACAGHHVGGAEGDPAAHVQGWSKILDIAPWLRKKHDRAMARPRGPMTATQVLEKQKDLDQAHQDLGRAVEAVADETQAEIVQRIFKGTVVEGNQQLEARNVTPDPKKDAMLAKLKKLAGPAPKKQEEDPQQSLPYKD